MDVSSEALEKYWQHVKANCNHETPPIGFDQRSVPLGLRGDDARFNKKGEKLVLYTMNSILHEPK